jgi:gas vesicle protein GvpL/GvpF
MRLYLYCLAEKLLHLEKSLTGIGGKGVESFDLEGLVVVVSQVEEEIVAATRENILAHDRVVRAAMKDSSPLPFRFGTLVTREGLVSYLAARRNSLVERLAEVRNCVEMSVKIIRTSDPQMESSNEIVPKLNSAGPGTAFLVARRRALFCEEILTEEAGKIARHLSARVKSVIKREQVTVQPLQKLVIVAAFLIQRDKELEYKREMAAFRQERPELHFLTSGPWPPYTFANIDLEFESHFGVS